MAEESQAKETPVADQSDADKVEGLAESFYGDEKPAEESKPEEKSDDVESEDKGEKEEEKSEEKSEEEVKEDSAKEEPKEASEKYELKQPKDFLLGEDHLQDVEKFAREHKMSSEQAQKLLDRDAKITNSFLKSQVDDHIVRVEGWAKEIEADENFGGDKFKETVVNSKAALDKFGSPELKKLLKDSGYGNHPEVVKVFAKIGKEISDDKFVHAGSHGGKSEKSDEDIFYGDVQQ